MEERATGLQVPVRLSGERESLWRIRIKLPERRLMRMKNNSAEPKKKANKIYSNIGLKLLSVVLGFLVWLLVLRFIIVFYTIKGNSGFNH